MRWDEQAAIRADERRALEARVMDVVDELSEAHDGDWPMQNAVSLIRGRLEVLFGDEPDDDS